jgi:hypothetical protein
VDESAEPEPRRRVQSTLRTAVLGAFVGAGFVTFGLLTGQASATAAENDSPGVSAVASVLAEVGHVIGATDAATDARENASLDSAASTISDDVADASRSSEKAVAQITSAPVPATSPVPAPVHHDPVVVVAAIPTKVVDTVVATAQRAASSVRTSVSEIDKVTLTPAVAFVADVAAPATDALGASELLPALGHRVGELPDTTIALLEQVALGPSPLSVPGLVPLPGVLPRPGMLPPSGPVDPVDGTGSAAAGPALGPPHSPAPLGATRHPGETAGPAARGEAAPFGVARAGNGWEEFRASGRVGAVFTSAGDLPPGDPTLPDSPLAALLNASSSAAPGSSGGPGSPALLPAGLLPRPGWGLDASHLAGTSWCGEVTLEPGSTPD